VSDLRAGDRWKRLALEIGKFGAVGILRTLTGAALLYLLPNVLGLNYVLSNVLVYAVGLIMGFLLHRRWVFGTRAAWRSEILPYSACFGIGYGANMLTLLILAEALHVDRTASQYIAMAVFTLVNYAANKMWTFRKSSGGSGPRAS
jgi:putative flippase GtrA